ncbi:Serine/threonine-protein phosphatase 4 regulatory subunit 4 [Chamberlinius hualienensis]
MRHEDDEDKGQSDSRKNTEPGSPPLEGGEAPYEILLGARARLDRDSNHQLITQLHTLFDDHSSSSEHLREIFPVIKEAFPDVQLNAGNVFLTAFERDQEAHSTFTHAFLQSILTSVDSKDPIVSNAWLETLLDVVELLPKDVIKKEILSLAVAKAQMSQSNFSRLASCRMLGKICCKFEPYMIKKEILPVVQSLCQDVEYEVRGCMCRQLDLVAKGLGLEATKNSILPELVELANDESAAVRLAAIETVVQMLSLLDDETCVQIIAPLVKKFCDNSLRLEDITLPVVAKQIGKLCHGLSVNLMPDQKRWFLDFYRKLSKLGYIPIHLHLNDHLNIGGQSMPDIVPRLDSREKDQLAECRLFCAFNLPAMTLFAGSDNFEQQLYDAFHNLANDPHSMVRRTIACGIHEIVRLLGANVHLIVGELISLLQDDSLEVIEGVIEHLPVTLELLAKESGNSISERRVEEVIFAVMECEDAVSRTSNWRLHSQLLEKLSCLPKCLPSAVIFHQFVPVFFKKLFTVRPIPCRMAAASTLLLLLKSNPRQDQKQQICSRLVEELCHGKSCHTRMLFVTICELVINIFSKSFFKDYFFLPLLRLAEDPVANVRLRLCQVIPTMKTVLRFPVDKELLQELETCVGKLMIDEEDRDVSYAVKRAIMELDQIEIPTENIISVNISLQSTRHNLLNSTVPEENRIEVNEHNFGDNTAVRNTVSLSQRQKQVESSKIPKSPGRIPVRTSLIGMGMLTQNNSVANQASTSKRNTQSKWSNLTDSNSVKKVANPMKQVESVSRIPMLARSTTDTVDKIAANRRERYISPPRPSPSTAVPALSFKNKPPALVKPSMDSPIPSPESIRRANQGRRKSLGPGTLVFSSTLPRATSASHRLSAVDSTISKSASNSPTHIPRYRSSLSSLLTDHGRLESLLLYSNCHSDYLSFNPINHLDFTNMNNVSHIPTTQSSEDFEPELVGLTDDINVTHGGGDKMFPFWSRNHKPRCTTPPVFEQQLGIRERGGRLSRSASSSPTPPLSLPKSSIPRYVGSNRTSHLIGSSKTQIRPQSSSNYTRAKSASQLTPPSSPWRKTAPGPSVSMENGRWNTRPERASSLPGTPRSISPTTANLHTTVFELNRRSSGWKEVGRQAPNDRNGRFTTSGPKSVRNIVKELESLSKNTVSGGGHIKVGWRRKSDEDLLSTGGSTR